MLLSASHDTTIRLWSLPLKKTRDKMSALVVYKGHIRPVWDVKFSPFGFYFASGSADHTAKLWVTHSVAPIRIFRGHFNDVDTVTFHPNIHYVATGSSDKTIRLWSVEDGSCVRIMLTNDSPTRCLKFTNNGKYLLSTNDKGELVIHDVQNCNILSVQENNDDEEETNALWCVDVSQDDKVVAVGSENSFVRMYSLQKILFSGDDIRFMGDEGEESSKSKYIPTIFQYI